MQVQKKDKDGKLMFDDKGNAVMEEGNASPDPAETAKKLEALERRMSETDGKLMSANERANRAEALLQSYISTGKPDVKADSGAGAGTSTIDVAQLVTEPQKVLGQVIKTAVTEAVTIMEKRYREAEAMKSESEGIRTSFYKTNSDLVGFEKIVGLVEQEYRMKFPNTRYSELLPEIAKAARAEVLDMQRRLNPAGGGTVIGLENGGASARGTGNTNSEVVQPSEESEFSSYMKERNESRTKKLA